MAGTGSQRVEGLDVLRAIAVLLVIGNHLPPSPPGLIWPVARGLQFFHAFGSVGVDLFFVLSGFLVSGLLFREYRDRHELRIGRFLVRRGLKIYPAFYFFITLSVALRLAYGDHITKAQVIAEVLFVQNYFQGVWTHTWSLAVEEHFYLLLALAFGILWRHSRRTSRPPFVFVPAAFLGLAALVAILRVWTFWFVPFSIQAYRFPTHLQVDSFMCGVALSYWFHSTSEVQQRARQYVPHLFLAGTFLTLAAFYLPTEIGRYVVGHVFTYVGFAAIVLGGVSMIPRGTGVFASLRRALAYVGTHSYSIYLWHTAVFVATSIAIKHLPAALSGFYGFAVIYVAGSVLVGIVTAAIVEFPVLRLRDRLFPIRSGPVKTATDGRPSAAL